jgi:hypothetical protein
VFRGGSRSANDRVRRMGSKDEMRQLTERFWIDARREADNWELKIEVDEDGQRSGQIAGRYAE